MELGLRRFVGSFGGNIASFPSSVIEGYKEFRRNFTESKQLQQELLNVRYEFMEYKIKNYAAEAAKEEYEQLRKQVGLSSDFNFSVVIAQVNFRDPVTWFLHFSINRGSKDGIEVGDAVLFDGYLVGRVSEVRATQSQVITIANPDCQISCHIKNSALYGVLKGYGGGSFLESPECRIDYLFRDATLQSGMIVQTSGYGAQIPAGIPVGTLIQTQSKLLGDKINNVYQQARVFPFVDFKNFSFVTVIIDKKK
ncbi:MAG: rod shape-determining protein MreC [Lentisphaeria bacterium]